MSALLAIGSGDAATLETINITMGTFSFIGSIFIITCYFTFRGNAKSEEKKRHA